MQVVQRSIRKSEHDPRKTQASRKAGSALKQPAKRVTPEPNHQIWYELSFEFKQISKFGYSPTILNKIKRLLLKMRDEVEDQAVIVQIRDHTKKKLREYVNQGVLSCEQLDQMGLDQFTTS